MATGKQSKSLLMWTYSPAEREQAVRLVPELSPPPASPKPLTGDLRKVYQRAMIPPSTIIGWPVMNDAASEARNATTEPISRGSPQLSMGTRKTLAYDPAIRSGSSYKNSVIPVLIYPGQRH